MALRMLRWVFVLLTALCIADGAASAQQLPKMVHAGLRTLYLAPVFIGQRSEADVIDTVNRYPIVLAGSRFTKTYLSRMLEAYPNLRMEDSPLKTSVQPIFEEFGKQLAKFL